MEFEKDLMKEKRETLTQMLVALMDQKEARQSELKDRLNELEKHKSEETENYWLIQYQKLLDSKPKVIMPLLFLRSSWAYFVFDFLKLVKTFFCRDFWRLRAKSRQSSKIYSIKLEQMNMFLSSPKKGVGMKQLTYMNDKQLSEVGVYIDQWGS